MYFGMQLKVNFMRVQKVIFAHNIGYGRLVHIRGGPRTEHARIPARSDHILGCSESSILELYNSNMFVLARYSILDAREHQSSTQDPKNRTKICLNQGKNNFGCDIRC